MLPRCLVLLLLLMVPGKRFSMISAAAAVRVADLLDSLRDFTQAHELAALVTVLLLTAVITGITVTAAGATLAC
jgi:hypothetical protein